MPGTASKLAEGSGPRIQALTAVQTLGSATGVLLAGTARAKGRIVRIYGGNMAAPLTGNATLDIMPMRYTSKHAEPYNAISLIPLLTAPGIRLESVAANPLNYAGAIEELSGLVETELVGLLTAAAAGQVTLPAAAGAVDGLWCDAEIVIIGGTGKGQINRLKSYAQATKVAKVKNAVGTVNWKTTPDATSLVWLRTRRYVCEKDDLIVHSLTYTANGGGQGTSCLAGLDLEYDDLANV